MVAITVAVGVTSSELVQILDDLGGTIIALDCNTVILKESEELIIIIQHHHCWRNIETRIPIVTMMLQVRRATSLSRRFSLGGSSNGYNFSTKFEFIHSKKKNYFSTYQTLSIITVVFVLG